MEIQAILTPTPIILQIQDAEEIYIVYFWFVWYIGVYDRWEIQVILLSAPIILQIHDV